MVDLGEDEDKFDSFMMPITNSFETLAQHLMNTNRSKLAFVFGWPSISVH